MVESDRVRGAKIHKLAAVVTESNGLKAGDEYGVSEVRRATRDAMAELGDEYDDPEDVREIALPSERLSDDT